MTSPRATANVGGGSGSKPLTPAQINEIREAENAAYNARTGADFGFKKMRGTPDWSKEILMTNPPSKYGHTPNCQRCVIAHEARMRGYDVIARPSCGDDDTLRSRDGWIKAFGFSYKNFKLCAGNNGKDVIESAERIMRSFGEGARAIIVFEWDKTFYPEDYGHVIVAQCKEHGIVNFGDPQQGNRAASKKLQLVDFSKGVILLRIDNLEFTNLVKRCCMNRK